MAQRLVLVADSSAWIAAYRTQHSAIKDLVVDAIKNHVILVPDLVLVEVLRGIGPEKEAQEIANEFMHYQVIEIGGKLQAIKAASNFRALRRRGVTIRGTVDLMIATWCIENNVPLLHADRDFAGFEEHLGLKRWAVDNSLPP